MVGFEALARWQHGELGWVSPADFIQVAENTGLVIPLGEAVLRTAVQEAVQWRHSSSGQQPYVSVNLSPRQVEATEVADWVQRAVTDAGLPVERLRLEITEATLLDRDHPERLRDLADLGIKLDLDDFGTGYSSLSYISELPLGGLKIDRSFVAGLGDARRAALVEAIISMAAALDLEVTAEGVETGEQRTQLIEMGCDFAQGFLLGRPASSGQTRARVRGISTAAGG